MPPTRPPGLTLNRLLVQDLMTAQPPCFALGYVQEHGSISGFMALRAAQTIPAASTNQGFRFGHSMLGLGEHPILHFAFAFYGHTTYHGLVNPSNPIVQAVIARMLETEDYFFFAINPDQTVTAFRSHLETADLAGLRTNQAQFAQAACPPEVYEQAVTAFRAKPDPPGQVLEWVCRHTWEYLDLTAHPLDLNPMA